MFLDILAVAIVVGVILALVVWLINDSLAREIIIEVVVVFMGVGAVVWAFNRILTFWVGG